MIKSCWIWWFNIKTSLPFVDYFEFGNADPEIVHTELANYYMANSNLYREYQKNGIGYSIING